jgi:two-component system, LuxR family, sensor kinase FixL
MNFGKVQAASSDLKALTAEAFYLASIIASSGDAIVCKDLDGRIGSWSGAAQKMFGYSPDEIIGQPVTVLFPGDLIAEEAMILKRLQRGDRIDHYETVRRHKDGRPVYVSLTISPICDANGMVIGVSKCARDIGQQVALSQRLDELRADLLHASRVNEMGQMASALAHELNQPLAAISAFVGGARRQVELGNAELALAGCVRAETEVMRTAEILRRLGDFMKKGPVGRQTEALPGVFDDAIALALIGPAAHGLKVEVQIADDATSALVDRIQLQQVLVNLIRNAAQAMEGQAVKSVAISVRRLDQEKVAVEVADNGPGLAADILARIFEPYFTTKPDGMGVGLSLCRSILESHGGELFAENAPGGGAVFRFTLLAD